MNFKLKFFIFLIFAYTTTTFSMFHRMRTFKNYLTRKVKTQKKSGQRYFSTKGTLLATTTLMALGISDDEKKKDSEELTRLLSQENRFFSEYDFLREIETLLEKYGYTNDLIYALLWDPQINSRTNLFNIFDNDLLWNDIQEYFIADNKDLKKKIMSRYWSPNENRIDNLTQNDLQEINIVTLKKSIASKIKHLLPWLLHNEKIKIAEDNLLFSIDLSNPLEMRAIIIKSLSQGPSPSGSISRISRQQEVFKNIIRQTFLLKKIYNSFSNKVDYIDKEASDLVNNIHLDSNQKNMLLNERIEILNELKKDCFEPECSAIDKQIEVFNGVKDPSAKIPNVLNPKTNIGPSSSMTSKPTSSSLLERILNHFGWYY